MIDLTFVVRNPVMRAVMIVLLVPCGTAELIADAQNAPPPENVFQKTTVSPRVQALIDAGHVAQRSKPARLDEAEKLYHEAIGVARSLQDRPGESAAMRNLGNVARARGQANAALDLYNESAAIAESAGDFGGQADSLYNAALMQSSSQPARAMEIGEHARLLYHKSRRAKEEADALNFIGTLHKNAGRYDRAQDCYEQAQVLAHLTGAPKSEADAFWFLGVLVWKGRETKMLDKEMSDKAKAYLQAALPLYSKANDAADEAWTATLLAGIWFFEGNLDQTQQLYSRALGLYRTTGDMENIAETLVHLGNVAALREQLVESLSCSQEALEIFRKIGSKVSEAVELRHIADLYTRFGQQQTGLQSYISALALFEQAGDIPNQITTLNSIGEVYDILGDHKTAQEYLRRVVPLLERPTSELERRHNLGILAGIYFQLGNMAKAREAMLKQRAEIEKAGMSSIIPTTSMLAMVEARLGHRETALGLYREALNSSDVLGNGLSRAGILGSIADIEVEKNDLNSAEKNYAEAIGVIEKVRTSLGGLSQAKSTFLDANIGVYRSYFGLLVQQNKTRDAFALAQKMKARGLLDILYDGKILLANSLTAEEREQERVLRQKSDGLNNQLIKEGVLNEIGSKKRSIAIRLQIGATERELQILEDRLYLRHPGLAEKRAARTISADDVAKFLPDNTALLEYLTLKIGGSDAVVLFVAAKHAHIPELSMHIIKVPDQELRRRLDAFNKACSDPRKDYRVAAAGIYNLLVAPAQPRLAGKSKLIICPDGPLWDAPFAAMVTNGSESKSHEGKKPEFLIDRFEIDYAYSSTGAAAALTSQKGRPRKTTKNSMLVFANPEFGDEARIGDNSGISGERPISAASRPISAASRPISAASRDLMLPRGGKLSQLPGTLAEARAIKADFPGAQVITGASAQEDIAKREAGRYRYLHFATHGFFNDSAPLLSAIVLAFPQTNSGADGLLTAREIFDLNLDADLVVLSACNTARGEKRSGEGIVGLTWALFAAGAQAQIVSQWSVNDESTSHLMRLFYGNLTHKHMAKGESLRQAILALKQGGSGDIRNIRALGRKKSKSQNPKYSHPYFWAPFILFGDWR